MIALNFQPVDGTEDIAISNLVVNSNDLFAGTGPGAADEIQVWNGEKFDVYFYRANKTTTPKWTKGPGWVKVGATSNLTGDTISRGYGIWFVRPESASAQGTLTLTGSVSSQPYYHAIEPGYNMISSAFPCDMKLNGGSIDWANAGAVAGTGPGAADEIQLWNGEKFDVYFYRANKTTTPKWTKGPGWVKVGNTSNLTEDPIPAGKGFWFVRPGSVGGSIEESSPIAK